MKNLNGIVFDLEATCEDRRKKAYYDNEVIEVGAVKVLEGIVVDEFQVFIKPIKNPILSDFCKSLTKIKQEDVDKGENFLVAIETFRMWSEDLPLLSWGFYDRKQLEKDCQRHGMDIGWLENHRSLKHEYAQIKKLKRGVGLQKALSIEGMVFEGIHHRGIDDAKNIAKIYTSVFDN